MLRLHPPELRRHVPGPGPQQILQTVHAGVTHQHTLHLGLQLDT